MRHEGLEGRFRVCRKNSDVVAHDVRAKLEATHSYQSRSSKSWGVGVDMVVHEAQRIRAVVLHVHAKCDQRKHPNVEYTTSWTHTLPFSSRLKKIPNSETFRRCIERKRDTWEKCSRSLGRCPVPVMGTVPLVFTRPLDWTRSASSWGGALGLNQTTWFVGSWVGPSPPQDS